MADVVEEWGFEPEVADTMKAGWAAINRMLPDVAIVDLKLPDGSGLDLLHKVKENYPDVSVIILTGHATVDSAVKALKVGAEDYVTKPVDLPRLQVILKTIEDKQMMKQEIIELRRQLQKMGALGHLVGKSPRMQRLFEELEMVANTDANVFIVGESGSGKEVVANTIHYVGEVAFFGAGVFVSGANDNVIGHNDIRHAARYAVSLKNWSPETVNLGNVVEYNRIRDTARETADAGAIETLGRSDVDTRTVIRYNDIRETGGLATDAAGRWLERYKGFGVYLDDLTNGVLVEGNFLMDTGWAAVFIHGGDNNKVENNIAVLTRPNDRFLRLEWVPKAGMAGFLRDNAITQNIIHLRAPVKDIVESHTGGQPVLEANVIDRPGSSAAMRAPVAARTQQGPRLANPYFVDPAADDFRLRPDGQARELGIADLPWSRIGPAGYPGR